MTEALRPMMGGKRARRMALILALVAWPGMAARAAGGAADPGAGRALVIGDATYAALPPLPACAGAARGVAQALRGAGFVVSEHHDASGGEIDGALAEFAAQLAAHRDAPAVIYVCGYAMGLQQRLFLLPVSASLQRRFDLLTQGIVAGALAEGLRQGQAAARLILLDLFRAPGEAADLPLDGLPSALGAGFAVAIAPDPAAARTPLANALAGTLAHPPATLGALFRGLTGSGLAFAASAPPAAAPPAPPVTPPPPPPPPPPTVPPAPPPSPVALDASLTQRRAIQAALARLGYYDGPLDGLFGPDTHAAIRRYQFEIKAPMTGTLSAAQAERLRQDGH
jgi:hypothetical protein